MHLRWDWKVKIGTLSHESVFILAVSHCTSLPRTPNSSPPAHFWQCYLFYLFFSIPKDKFVECCAYRLSLFLWSCVCAFACWLRNGIEAGREGERGRDWGAGGCVSLATGNEGSERPGPMPRRPRFSRCQTFIFVFFFFLFFSSFSHSFSFLSVFTSFSPSFPSLHFSN